MSLHAPRLRWLTFLMFASACGSSAVVLDDLDQRTAIHDCAASSIVTAT